MKLQSSPIRFVLRFLVASGLLVSHAASAQPWPSVSTVAEADCYGVGEEIAAQNGGTLAKARSSTQGGQPVCVIVVLVPGRDGERPRRREIVVPQN